MKKYLYLFGIVFILVVSGCSQKANTELPSAKAISDLCGNSSQITSYTFDVNADSLDRVDIAKVLEAKCGIFTKCHLDSEKNLFKLYTQNVGEKTESAIFNKIDFRVYMSLEPDLNEKNETKITLEDKDYPIHAIDDTNLDIDGRRILRDNVFTLGNYTLKFFSYEKGPIFQILIVDTDDVRSVDVGPPVSFVKKLDNGIGVYSFQIGYSEKALKRIVDIVKNTPIKFIVTQTAANSTELTQDVVLKSKLYYYVKDNLLSSVYVPASLKDLGDNIGNAMTVNGVGSTFEFASRQFNDLVYGLKIASSSPITILKKEPVSCKA